MESLQYPAQGFGTALQPINILWVTVGGVLGTLVGMLPGLGPATGVAVLLPLTYSMGPVAALITMGGVYYGAMYGGSRASILFNTPGDGDLGAFFHSPIAVTLFLLTVLSVSYPAARAAVRKYRT